MLRLVLGGGRDRRAENLLDRRERVYHLTAKGKALLKTIALRVRP
jgi:hypothetical protein